MLERLKGLFIKGRIERILAMLIDFVILIILIAVSFSVTGNPDYIKIQQTIKASRNLAASGQNAAAQVQEAVLLFNNAFFQTLKIYFIYEVLTQIILGGSTIGKKILGLKVVAINEKRSIFLNNLLMIIRTFLKLLFILLFQGFPFIISAIYVFADESCRGLHDRITKMKVVKV